ncbi:MarR family transcriptional regulator [Candidatus Harpocratesius sp.]
MGQTSSLLQKWLEIVMRLSMHNVILFSKKKNLSMSQISALMFIHRQNRCGISNLGSNLGITSAAASQMLDRLVKQQFITRQEDPNDRRVKKLTLTEKGKKILKESFQARQYWQKELIKMLTPEEEEKVQIALKILIHKSEDLVQPQKHKCSEKMH